MCRKLFWGVWLVLALGLAGNASAMLWTNTTGDEFWSTPGNWDTGEVPTSADTVYMNNGVGPTINSSTTGYADRIFGPGNGGVGSMTMTIDGGTLNVTGPYWSIAHGGASGGGIGTVNVINNATVNNNADLYVGNYGNGTLNIGTLGAGDNTTITTGKLLISMREVSDYGHVYLYSGLLDTVDLTGYHTGNDILIDIYEGTFIVRDKEGASMQHWIDIGYVKAYGGAGTVILETTPEGWDKLTANVVLAYNPNPADGAEYVPTDVVLSWSPGEWAVSHDVYLGTNFNDVNNASRLAGDVDGDGWVDLADVLILAEQWLGSPESPGPSADLNDDGDVDIVDFAIVANHWMQSASAVFRGNQEFNSYYDPCGFEPNETYYWRIDEVNGPNTWRGDVWSFTVRGCLYDFISNASSANWQSRGGAVTFGDEFTNEKGCAKLTSGALEDGSYVTDYLYTRPDCNSGFTEHWMRGTYSNISIPEGAALVNFTAKVGFETTTSSSDGVTFSLFIQRSDGCYELCAVDAEYDGVITNLSADLTVYKGQTITVILSANAGDTCEDDQAVWKEAKIVAYVTYEPELVYDFAANADKASWRTGAGSIDFNDPNNPENGFAQISDGNLEDGNYYTDYLFTRPDYGGASKHFIEGTFDNVIIPKNVTDIKFTATVGLADGAQSSNGVIFLVYVSLRDKITELCCESEVYDGELATITANLSAYQGENISIILYIDPNGNTNYDWAAWIEPRITAELPMQIYVNDKGAEPDDGIDDLSAFNDALSEAKTMSPAEIYFSSGTYNLSGRFYINYASNINLRGYTYSSGTTKFIMGNPSEPTIMIRNSDNISTRDITIDYDPLPFTQGNVSELNTGNKSFKFTIDPGYTELDDPLFNSGYGLYRDPNTAVRGRTPLDCGSHIRITSRTKLSAGVYRVYVNDVLGAYNGVKFTFRKPPGHNTCDAWGGHILWNNVTVYASPCIGFAGVKVDKMRLRNCSVKFEEGTTRFLSSNFDAAHTRVCKKGPDIIDCLFEGMGDDGFNNGGVGSEILAKQSETRFSVYFDLRPVNVGDYLLLFRPSDGKIGSPVEVVTIHGMVDVGGYQCHDITVSGAPAGFTVETGSGKDQFFNTDYSGNDYLISGCTFRNCHANGIRAKAYNGVIKDNTFEGLASRAIQVSNLSIYKEGLQSGNILIKNNTIDHCGFHYQINQHNYSGVIVIAGQKSGGDAGFGLPADANDLNYNITIEGNTIYNWPRHAIYVSCTDGIKILNNTLTNYNHWTKASSGWRGIMFFDNARDVEVKDNTVVDARPSSQINGKLFIKAMTTGDITTQNNSYTVNTSASEVQVVTSY